MNNQSSVGEQLLQLQNIAYMKQFMQKASVKILFLVSLLLAFANSFLVYSFKDVFESVINFLFNFGISDINPDDFSNVSNFFGTIFTASAISTAIFGLILPITLLYIIIRSRSENPSVIPSGAVKFLHVLSFIQTIFVVASASVTLISEVITIFGAEDKLSAIISVIAIAVSLIMSCLYYILQTKFLSAVKKSSKGFTLVYGTSKGFGVLSVLTAIINGVISACSLVLAIVLYSLLGSTSVENNQSFDNFIAMGGLEFIEKIKPIAILFIVIAILNTIYQAFVASTAFAYKETVRLAVRESFNSHKKPGLNNNSSAFRTYGGSNSFTNYNYSNSGVRGQQAYRPSDTQKSSTNNVIPEAPVEPTVTNNSIQQNNIDTPNYNEPIIGNGSFTPVQQQFDNNIHSEPVTMNGSFGINQD